MDTSHTTLETLAWVDDDRAIRQFMRAPYHGHLKSQGNTRFFYDTTPLRGLTDPLRECFWSQEASAVARRRFYSRDPGKASKAPKAKRTAPTKKTLTASRGAKAFFAPAPLKKPRPTGKTGPRTNAIKTAGAHSPGIAALRQGSQVHRQIDQVVKLGADAFLERNASLHPYVLDVILELHHFTPQLRILYSEYLAGCPQLGIATRIDLVCVDKAGTIYIVETKTGSSTDYSWKAPNGKMRGPLEHYFGNSAHNRAKVQAIAGAMLAILGTQLSLGQVRCLVAHVNDNVVKLKLVPDALTATVGPIIYSALLAHQAKWKYRQRLAALKQEGAAIVVKQKKKKAPGQRKKQHVN